MSSALGSLESYSLDHKGIPIIYIFLIPPYLRRGTGKETDLCFTSLTSWHIDGETVGTVADGAPKSPQMVTAAMKLKYTCCLEEKL